MRSSKIIGTRDWDSVPFEQYLLVNTGGEVVAYEMSDEEPMDLGALLRDVLPGYSIDIGPRIGGENYAAIITDGRPANSAIVWDSCGFYLEADDY